jgi:hypothetical protein
MTWKQSESQLDSAAVATDESPASNAKTASAHQK